MSLATKAKNGGWGALFLWVYTLVILLWFEVNLPNQRLLVLSLATIPSLIVMFVAELFMDFLNDWWVGGNLKRSTEIATEVTKEDHPYEVLSSDAQDRITDIDGKAYGKQVTILTGLVIGFTVPFFGYLEFGLPGILAGLCLTPLVLWAFVYRSVLELKDLASGIAEIYQHKYENK